MRYASTGPELEPRSGFSIGLGCIGLAVILAVIGVCANKAEAQETAIPATPDFPPGDDRIIPLVTGERAPFDGQLFDQDTALRFGFRIQRLRLQLEQGVAREREICAVQTDLWETKFDLNQERYDFNLGLLRIALADSQKAADVLAEQLAEAGDPPWYRTVEFGIVVGVVGTVVVGVLVGVLIYELK